MKKIIVFACIAFVVFSFPCIALASEESVEEFFPKDAGELLLQNGFSSLDMQEILNLTPAQALEYVLNSFKNELDTPFVMVYFLFLVIIITSITSGINGGFLSKELENNFSTVGVLSVCTTALVPIVTCAEQTREFITQISGFARVFVPVLSAVMISGGQVNSGVGYQTVMIFATEFLSVFLSGIILPLIFFYLAFSVVGRTAAGFNTDSITNSVKSTVNFSLSLVMTLFVALVTIKGIIGTGSDSVALRTGKFFVGSFVPAVGGALAEAAATMQKSMGLIKNTTGVFGIIAAALYFIPPLVKVLIYKFTCSIISAVGQLLGADKIAGLLKDISSVLSLMVSVILSFASLIVLSTAVTLIISGGG
ncbi:MAG: hypothetical protein E7539_00930 [Ruminococcaceae bacterium]|nr:hypothetical protein [Oscillospiraceae bacterium]